MEREPWRFRSGKSIRQAVAPQSEALSFACANCRPKPEKTGVRRTLLLDEKALASLCKTKLACLMEVAASPWRLLARVMKWRANCVVPSFAIPVCQ